MESDLYAGETYDARREIAGWCSPAEARQADESGWKPVTVYTDQDPQLNAQMDQPIRVVEEVATKQVTEPKPRLYVFDMGQNMVGWARLRVSGPAGTQVVLRFGEVLNPDGTVYRDNLRRARATDTYILKGGGTEVWEPHFTYHGFRYVEVSGLPVAEGRMPAAGALTGVAFCSSMPETSRFSCSSELVNRLFRNILWGQRGNLMSVPTDCPQRDERLGWMGDAEIFARTACFNMDMAAFFTKWTRDIMDAQSAEGFFSDVSPRVVDMADGAPAWADAGIVVPWTVYQCYGDTRLADRAFPSMQKYVDLLVRANPELLWLRRRNNDFGDWVAAGGQTPKELIASAFLAYDLELLADMAKATGRTAEAGKYGRLSEQAREAFNRKYLAADGKIAGDSQTAYAIAIGMHLVPPDLRKAVGQQLLGAVRARQDHLSTGFIGTAFLLPALTATGHPDTAYRLLLNNDYPSWGYTISKGATTIWELWNSDTAGPGMNSRNHFAFGAVGEWIQRDLAGIDTDPTAPGYSRIRIRPQPGPCIDRAATEYDSIRGRIVSRWNKTPGSLTLEVTLPTNTTAEVAVPATDLDARILEGGRLLWQGERFIPGTAGISAGRRGAGAVVFDVGGGTYRFEVRDAR